MTILRPIGDPGREPIGELVEPPPELPFSGGETVEVHAYYVGERIETRTIETEEELEGGGLTMRLGEGGLVILFRYGVVIFVDVAPERQATFLADLAPQVVSPWAEPETESAILRRVASGAERPHNGVVRLRRFDLERVQLVADALAKSVVLAHYEEAIAEAFARVEPLATGLRSRGRSGRSARELLQHIGGALLIQVRTTLRVEVNAKPEVLWESPQHEALYLRLADEYELAERHQELERKLTIIERTATTALELLQTERSLRVEWYIVALIVVEIGLSLYDIFVRG